MPKKGYKQTKEHRLSHSKSVKGAKHPFYGKKHSEKTKRKIGKASIARGARPPSRNSAIEGKNTPERISWIKNRRNRVLKRIKISNGTHTFNDWELLKKRYNNTCPCCKKSEAEIKLTEDHIIPLNKGGNDLIENIQPLCGKCNRKKHTKIIKY